MSPHPRRRSAASSEPRPARRQLISFLIVALLAGSLAACSAPFDPTGPCTADGSAAGAYPELEAAVPKLFRAAAPAEVDSGRTCTTAGLGTLAGHGLKEVRFAGATWSTGNESGVSLAVFSDPTGATLDLAWLLEFYETGAKTGKNVTSVEASDFADGAVVGRRLDVLNGESYQTVVLWQNDGQVAAAIVASAIREIQTKDAHEAVVRDAIAAYASAG